MTGKGKLQCPKFLKLGSHTLKDSYNLMILGDEGVGKTALVVRFLARRFLTEYAHTGEMLYERHVQIGDKVINIRITDTSGKESVSDLEEKEALKKADGCMIAFSLTDRLSFEKAKDLINLVSLYEIPTTLIANKEDLVHLRQVNILDGQKLALIFPSCSYFECSAANGTEGVDEAFHNLLQKMMRNEEDKRRDRKNSFSLPLHFNPKSIIKRQLSFLQNYRDRTSSF